MLTSAGVSARGDLSLSGVTYVDAGRSPMAVIDVAAQLRPGQEPGAPLVFVPGISGSKEDFLPILGLLALQGHRSVAIDLPGQFESPAPAGPADYSLSRLGADVLGVLAAVRSASAPAPCLVGHSFGGLVAREAVLAGPASVSGLVLLCTGPAMIPTARRVAIRLLVEALSDDAMSLEDIWSAVTSYSPANEVAVLTPEFRRERFLRSSRESLAGMGQAILGSIDRTDDLAATGVPVLVAHGDDDGWPIPLQHDVARRLGADVAAIPDAVHAPAVENPRATVDSLLSWLGSSPREAGRGHA